MLALEVNVDREITVALSDDSGIEIKIVEFEGSKYQITVHSNESVSVVKTSLKSLN